MIDDSWGNFVTKSSSNSSHSANSSSCSKVSFATSGGKGAENIGSNKSTLIINLNHLTQKVRSNDTLFYINEISRAIKGILLGIYRSLK